jgi:antirestriction protein
MDEKSKVAPRIYVACLASYNAGLLHGEWIDPAQDLEDLYNEIQAMLAASPVQGAEEWAIHDYEGFTPLNLGEHPPLDQVREIALLIEEHGPAYAAYADYVGSGPASEDGFKDTYQGTWGSFAAYAKDYINSVEGLDKIPEDLRRYFDYEAYARDLDSSGDCYSIFCAEGVYVFGR